MIKSAKEEDNVFRLPQWFVAIATFVGTLVAFGIAGAQWTRAEIEECSNHSAKIYSTREEVSQLKAYLSDIQKRLDRVEKKQDETLYYLSRKVGWVEDERMTAVAGVSRDSEE